VGYKYARRFHRLKTNLLSRTDVKINGSELKVMLNKNLTAGHRDFFSVLLCISAVKALLLVHYLGF